VRLIVSQTATDSSLVAFANEACHFNPPPITVAFDGQTLADHLGLKWKQLELQFGDEAD
jgi:hypothetical protein